jgi:acetyl-CoA carboxylase biotin carboxylase subunit
MKKISRVLVANRSEIAVRVIRACRDLGIQSVLAASEADGDSLAARMADRVVCIGPPPPIKSYLNVGAIIMAALGTGAEAIHPGYGFLAEQPELPKACERYGILFIGPKADQIHKMGDKLWARKMAMNLGVPVIPGSQLVNDFSDARLKGEKVGFPVLIKAAAGGGGRGMKIAHQPADLKVVFDEASAEAHAAFGDDRLYLERYIPNARHVEVQILGDRFGQIVHLGERDCSLQRRYQKMVEEAPSPAVSPQLRQKMCRAALDLTRQIQYENAGTVEFILDQDEGRFYFLEMNTRIQVEHPVTEMITGIDLVQEQIRIAAGHPVPFSQEEIRFSGHAIECRITAESPRRGFQPCPGRIQRWEAPGGAGIRLDTHCYPGYFVPPFYDSLLAKLIATGKDRAETMKRMEKALENFHVSGVETTIPFHRFILQHADYHRGKVNTRWLEELLMEEYEAHEKD